MRFSVDAHAIGRHLTGNEVYVRNLLHGFASLDQSAEFIAYLSRNVSGAAASVPERIQCRYVSGNSFVRLGSELARRVREDGSDLLHVQYTAPLNCSVPVIVSVHDISFLEHPEYFPWYRALQLRVTVKRTMLNAVKVITPSEFSRSRILAAYNLDPDRVEVVPIAVSSIFRPISREVAARNVSTRFGLGNRYVICVGDLQPRKNQLGLISAFERLVADHPTIPHELVMVGKDTWFSGRVHERAANSPLASRIRER